MNTEERRKIIIMSLENKENWTPNFSKLSRESGIPISTIHDFFNKRLLKDSNLLFAVEIIREPDATKEFIKRQIRDDFISEFVYVNKRKEAKIRFMFNQSLLDGLKGDDESGRNTN